MLLFRITSFFVILSLSIVSFSQNIEKSINLKWIEVSKDREDFFCDNQKSISIDSFMLNNFNILSVDEMLSWTIPVNIRRYGSYGAASNISIRGSSTSQVQVNWNGFPLNSVVFGTVNLSNTYFNADEISVHLGAPSSLYGSAINALNINNKVNWSKKNTYSIFTEVGSYGIKKYGVNLQIGNSKVKYRIMGQYHKSDGNFEFIDLQQVKRKRENNSLKESSLSQFLFLKLPFKQTLDVGFSFTLKNLDLPNSLNFNSTPSQQTQKDKEIRIYTKWKKIFPKSTLHAKSAYFNSFIKYDNPSYNNFSETKIQQFFSDIEYRYYASSAITFDIAGKYTHQNATVVEYNKKPKEHNFSLLVASKLRLAKILVNLSGRLDFFEKASPKPQFSIGGKYFFISNKITIKSNLSSHYRVPTFNDKYWVPGGNENLRPEKSLNISTSMKWFALKNNKSNLSVEASAFQTNTKNYIVWQLIEGETYYGPLNIGKVKNKGWELNTNYSQQIFAALKMVSKLNYHYIYAKDELTAKLLHYVPKHELKFYNRLHYNDFYLINNLHYRDKVTTSEYTKPLDEYWVWDAVFGKKISLKNLCLYLTLKAYNICNTSYQHIDGYPIPLRHYRIGIKMDLK